MTNPQPVPEVPAADVPDGGWLLDIREPYEWAAGHVPAATHIPMGELNQRAAEIPMDATVYVICRSGNRSAYVARALARSGWQAVNVGGGMQDWAAAGRPMISETGSNPTVAQPGGQSPARRVLLVPATIRLLGRANWWAPAQLRGLYAGYGISESGGDPAPSRRDAELART